MDMMQCSNCGSIFNAAAIVYVEEARGEYWGAPCAETVPVSPCCHSDFTEYQDDASQLWICEDCGKIWRDDEIDKEWVNGFGTEWEIERRCPECLGEVGGYVE